MVLTMLRSAKDIPAKFVLFDSWFTMPKTVIRVKRENRDVIGMIRITEKIHYQYQGKWQNVKSIYQKIKKSSNTKGIIGSVCVKLREDRVSTADKFIDAKIVFVKDRSSDNWHLLLCTDISVSDEEVVRVYGKRWDIEVFFKVCKSYLALAKEYQGRSYDMQVAATTIVFLRYAMLSMEARNATDDRTIGDLFFYLKEELQDIKLSQSLMLLVDTLRQTLSKLPLISQEMAKMIMDTFLNTIPQPLRQKLLLCA
ncbi:transposase [Tepidanaerobacter acetatoxydans]|uniref:IS4 family transposase n=1 Tax=Tepidanaerobacter acetatoxydans TaxID=499229 RepID=UPI0006626A5F|nr:transposase [Tepidanaerobacter acetatoxydans]